MTIRRECTSTILFEKSALCRFSSRVASRSRSAISVVIILCCDYAAGQTRGLLRQDDELWTVRHRRPSEWVIGHSIAAMDDRFLSACVDWLRVCLQQSRRAICLTFEVFNASVIYTCRIKSLRKEKKTLQKDQIWLSDVCRFEIKNLKVKLCGFA